MSAKRNLPSWMNRTDHHQPINAVGKTSEESTNKDARANWTRRIVYWMNEQELVETATDVLRTDNTKLYSPCALNGKETRTVPETDTEETSDPGPDERTYVSDTDVDVAEQDTVPYGEAVEDSRPSTVLHSTAEHVRTQAGSTTPKSEDNCQGRNSDPDPLQLVREIFFS
ncbi:uncharacterized protein LOC143526864 [Brachyhypopomus gauderio]|uniref:uncharacterized protein LOC143526864 n=1 Tax=Brachyhypopomus gauderio TaxID=698409 RepID=UPI004042AC81